MFFVAIERLFSDKIVIETKGVFGSAAPVEKNAATRNIPQKSRSFYV
jgi:hypothetical protein